MCPPASSDDTDDKRSIERAPVTLKVEYKRLNTFFADYTKNISQGGTFIKTTKPLPIGTEFIFVLSLLSLNQKIELLGEVVWIKAEGDATEKEPAGMGIRFKFKGELERAAVSELVRTMMTEALGPHVSSRLLSRKPAS